MIYLDNAATTKMFDGCVKVYGYYACEEYFNPSSMNRYSLKVAKDLEEVRKRIVSKLGHTKGTIIFTSGATESNNLAIMGSKRNGKWEYVFSVGEHPSVYNVAKELEMQGNIIHFVGLQPNGQIDYQELREVLNEKTRLISIMHVSNETGAINDLKLICDIKKQFAPNSLLHVDGVQAFCKIPFELKNYDVDFYTISAHKFHGPKGVGGLYVKNINSLKSIVYGGGQELNLRSGTENVPGIMAMDYAIQHIDINKNFEKVNELKEKFSSILKSDANVNIFESASPYILTIGFNGVNGETLMRALQDKDIVVGTGSACSTKKAGNRVLENIGMNKEEIKTHIRISFNADLTLQEIEKAGKIILQVYNDIREKIN